MKSAVLSHVQSLFDEMEKEMALSHQEKYALLEDALENATDEHELRVAFDQWHAEHAEDLGFEDDEDDLELESTLSVFRIILTVLKSLVLARAGAKNWAIAKSISPFSSSIRARYHLALE